VSGPVFISVGAPEKLAKFLEVNPELKGSTALIDDSSDFAAYRAAGFRSLLGENPLTSPPDWKPWGMGPSKWFLWLQNWRGMSPDNPWTFPPGVRVLGGTYALNGSDVVFKHQDVVPGATPDINAVLRAVGA